MNTFTLTIDTDNAAFDNPYELPRLIAQVAEDVADMDNDGLLASHTRSVLDVNGNRVGSWAIKDGAS